MLRPVRAESYVAVIAGEGWHRGVIGIAASKIAERVNRPCVVFSSDAESGVAHGSGRSIEPYHLLDGLTSCADLFEKFGGHSHAAGITIKPDRIAELRRRLNLHAASCLTDEDLQPCVHIDAELPTGADHVRFGGRNAIIGAFWSGQSPAHIRGAQLVHPLGTTSNWKSASENDCRRATTPSAGNYLVEWRRKR